MSISIGDITSGSMTGNGDFDVLVRAVKEHLLGEYSAGRITGDKYAEAYIALVNQAMAMAIQFRIQSEQVNIQSLLTDEQKALIVAQTDQVKADTLNIPKQGIVLDKQALQLDEQIKLTTGQIAQVEAQTQQINADILNIPKQGIILDKQASNLDKDLMVKEKDITLRQSNIDLTDQKTKTEQAQILDMVDGVTVQGTIGKQKAVYDAQIKGFQDDALQKATKTMTDIWSVQRSTDVGIQPTAETKLYDSNIGSAIESLFTSLKIPVASVPLVAYVNGSSASTGSEVIQTGENLAVKGNIGASGAAVTSVTVRDTDSKVVQATNINLSNKDFTATIPAASIATLKRGELVVTAKIRNSDGREVSISDGATKGY